MTKEEELVPIMAHALAEENPTENATMADAFVPILVAAVAQAEEQHNDDEDDPAEKKPTKATVELVPVIAHTTLMMRDEDDPADKDYAKDTQKTPCLLFSMPDAWCLWIVIPKNHFPN